MADAYDEEMAAMFRDAARYREAVALLRIFQSWLGASREQCDESGRFLWDRIEAACTHGVALPLKGQAE